MPVLYSNDFMTREERERAIHPAATDSEKIHTILTALERRISVQPNVFHQMLDALAAEPALNEVRRKIKGKLIGFKCALFIHSYCSNI